MVGLFNSHKPWTLAEDLQLILLAAENIPTRIIAFKLGRTELAIYARASQLGISLMPIDQASYNSL